MKPDNLWETIRCQILRDEMSFVLGCIPGFSFSLGKMNVKGDFYEQNVVYFRIRYRGASR